MSTEVFRFVTIRPPQEVTPAEAAVVVDLGLAQSSFVDSLRQLRVDGTRSGMIGAAVAFTQSEAFIGSPQRIDKPFIDFMGAAQQLPEHDFFNAAIQGVQIDLRRVARGLRQARRVHGDVRS
ncbi:MAG: hypothetical protein H0U99_07820 [Chthoniobacterales bacterium]|nr:hypothetical protein [Chthoniobacterales bacterium]